MKLVMNQKILLGLILGFGLNFFSASAQANPVIALPEPFDCARGQEYLDIEVTVGTELFQFRAQCDWHIEEFFVTATGDQCQVYSSMCTQEKESVRLWVYCDEGGRAIDRVACPRFP